MENLSNYINSSIAENQDVNEARRVAGARNFDSAIAPSTSRGSVSNSDVVYQIMWHDGGEYGSGSDFSGYVPYNVYRDGKYYNVAFKKESEAKNFCKESMKYRNSGSTDFTYEAVAIDIDVDPYSWDGTPD